MPTPRIGDKIELIVGYSDTTVHLHGNEYVHCLGGSDRQSDRNRSILLVGASKDSLRGELREQASEPSITTYKITLRCDSSAVNYNAGKQNSCLRLPRAAKKDVFRHDAPRAAGRASAKCFNSGFAQGCRLRQRMTRSRSHPVMRPVARGLDGGNAASASK